MKKLLTIISIFLGFFLVGYYWWQQRITISVVIPVYNAEKYLAKCLDSIFIQSGTYEVIAVNDGSTDKSLEILKKYAEKHENMIIIDQKNQGISAARNAGLKRAKNKYVTFIDNDDWWEPDAFAVARKAIRTDKPDILLTDFYDVYDRQWVKDTRGEVAALSVPEENKFPKRDIEKLSLFSPFYAKDALSDLYYAGTWVVHSFFLRKFLLENNILFPDKTDNGEDLIFLFRAYAYNPYITAIKTPIYNYYNRVSSASKGLATLNIVLDRMIYMGQTSEYQKMPRRVQLWIDDSFLGILFVGIANLQRHGLSISEGLDKIYGVTKYMAKYNREELKSARNYQRLKTYFKQIGLNRLL